MADTLDHRGPDGDGAHTEPGILIGFRRLAIVDLETGHQPIASEDGHLVLVCNGEIYNAPELRRRLEVRGHRFRSRSDVEVILHLYEERGVELLGELRGMFGFALWDRRRRRLLLARDRLGVKPLHWALTDDGLVFGSEIKALLASGRLDVELDPAALAELFTTGGVGSPRTLFRGIHRLPPGHYLVYEAGTASVRRYWRVGFPAPGTTPRRSAGEWAEGLRERLEESVRLHLRSDVPVGAWLSPGIDSSTVAALARRALGHPLPTFTLGFDDPDADELRGARTLPDFHPDDFAGTEARCTVADFQRYPRALWHTEVPSAAGIEVPRMVISESAAHAVKVVLTGEGADEVLGGYPWYRGERALAPLGRLPAPVRRWIAHRPWIEARWPGGARVLEGPSRFGTERYLRLINAPATTDALEAMLSADHRAAIDAVAAPDGDRLPSDADWPRFQKLQAYDLGHRLEAILHRVDRASMAHSLEVRVPFLDQEVVEFCAAIPPSVKLGWRREKEVLRRAVRDLLPPEIVRRRKRGMRAPFRTWLRGPLPAFAEELLSPASIREKGYFDPAAVARLVATDRDARWTRSRLAVLTIQLWDEIFRQGWRPPYWTP